MSETVALDFEIKSPIQRVWHALTDPAVLAQWMMFDPRDFQPVVGHRFHFQGKPSTGWTASIDCEVLAVEAPHRLSYSWVVAAWGGGSDLHQTKVTWTLTESDSGTTRLHLEQSGFDDRALQEISGAKYGWMGMLEQLRTLLGSQQAGG